MACLSARFFHYLQGADFYRRAHAEAVHLLPRGHGSTWLDLGCGTGLVTRLAAEHDYRAIGIDLDPWMVRLARASDGSTGSRYAVGDALAGHGVAAQVVSAGSLLFTQPDREAAAAALWRQVALDGVMLVIETTAEMRLARAWRWLRVHGVRGRNLLLLLWAVTRRHGKPVDVRALDLPGAQVTRHLLLDGMVAAWIVRKPAPSSGFPRARWPGWLP